MFLTKDNKTGASAHRQKKYPHNSEKRDQSSPTTNKKIKKMQLLHEVPCFQARILPN